MERSSKKTGSPAVTARPKRTRRAADSPKPQHTVAAPDIARLAYEIYETRGRADGAQLDDWLEAERQLRKRAGA
jgi:hypothetical protein